MLSHDFVVHSPFDFKTEYIWYDCSNKISKTFAVHTATGEPIDLGQGLLYLPVAFRRRARVLVNTRTEASSIEFTTIKQNEKHLYVELLLFFIKNYSKDYYKRSVRDEILPLSYLQIKPIWR